VNKVGVTRLDIVRLFPRYLERSGDYLSRLLLLVLAIAFLCAGAQLISAMLLHDRRGQENAMTDNFSV